jgi:hypothetical protein
MITRVTITGADDSIHPEDLLTLSNVYPFVEWGILFSSSNQSESKGSNRFPSLSWVKELAIIKRRNPELNLSTHLCGKLVRDIVMGRPDLINKHMEGIFDIFSRVQINTHGYPHEFNPSSMVGLLKQYPEKEFIFQYDNENEQILSHAHKEGVKCSALFDLSHGAGVLPEHWPDLLKDIPCGYAGGLGPDNLEEQIMKIEAKAGATKIWIDMETKVFTTEGAVTYFDLSKVEECLHVSKYIAII